MSRRDTRCRTASRSPRLGDDGRQVTGDRRTNGNLLSLGTQSRSVERGGVPECNHTWNCMKQHLEVWRTKAARRPYDGEPRGPLLCRHTPRTGLDSTVRSVRCSGRHLAASAPPRAVLAVLCAASCSWDPQRQQLQHIPTAEPLEGDIMADGIVAQGRRGPEDMLAAGSPRLPLWKRESSRRRTDGELHRPVRGSVHSQHALGP